MSLPSALPSATRHVLAPAVPLRPVIVVAVASALGALLAVGAAAAGLPWPVSLVGGVVVLVALVLAVRILLVVRRGKVTVALDDDGWAITGPSGAESGRWLDVTAVKVAETGREMLIESGPRQVHVVLPPHDAPALVAAMYRDMVARLDASRGYRSV